jgi:hypothetical protein
MSNTELDAKVIEDQQQPQQPQQTINLSLGINDLNIVMAALQELPHRVADPVLRNLMGQAQAQLQQ